MIVWIVSVGLGSQLHAQQRVAQGGEGAGLVVIKADPFGTGEVGTEVLEDAAEDVLGPVGDIGKLDGADEVGQFAEAGIVAPEGVHGFVDDLAGGAGPGLADCFLCHAGIMLIKAWDKYRGKG